MATGFYAIANSTEPDANGDRSHTLKITRSVTVDVDRLLGPVIGLEGESIKLHYTPNNTLWIDPSELVTDTYELRIAAGSPVIFSVRVTFVLDNAQLDSDPEDTVVFTRNSSNGSDGLIKEVVYKSTKLKRCWFAWVVIRLCRWFSKK